MALSCPELRDPKNSQFFLLCGAPHKKNYAEPVIMLSQGKLAA